jgi:hypothetical protein
LDVGCTEFLWITWFEGVDKWGKNGCTVKLGKKAGIGSKMREKLEFGLGGV